MTIRQTILLLILFIFSSHLFAQVDIKVDSLIQLAKQQTQQEEYQKAVENYNKALSLDNNHATGISGKVEALLLSGEERKAERFVDDELEKKPQDAILLYNKGVILNFNEQYKKAVKVFNRALRTMQVESIRPDVYLARGIAHRNLENYETAIQDLSIALDLSPDNINALYHRGYAHYKTGNFGKAIDDFQSVTELDKKNAYAFYNLGMAYYKTDNKQNACYNFQKACQLGNQNACQMVLMRCAK